MLRPLEDFSTRAIVRRIFGRYAELRSKKRWGDKTPRYRSHVRALHRFFRDAKFILIFRDGRDTAMSSFGVPFGPRFLGEAALLWSRSMAEASRELAGVPPYCWTALRYETLLEHPEAELRRICEFLDEDYEEEMLSFHEQAADLVPSWESEWHKKTRSLIDPSNAGKWRRQLSHSSTWVIEFLAGRELARNGYALSRPPMRPADCAKAAWELALTAAGVARGKLRRGDGSGLLRLCQDSGYIAR